MSVKRIIAIFMVLFIAAASVNCNVNPEPDPAQGGQPPSSASGTQNPPSANAQKPALPSSAPEPTGWAVENNLHIGSETAQELYEKALAQGETTVTVYTISSRWTSIKESFEAQYPGITVDPYDMRANDLYEKFSREYEAGIRNVDLIHCKDNDGMLYLEYVSKGILHNYYPDDIISTIPNKDYLSYAMPLYIELDLWFYNYGLCPDGPPIDSWWDLTLPEWNGRVVLQDPLENMNLLAILTAMTQNPKALEDDYRRVTGETLVLSPGCPTAAHELLKRLLQNNIIITTSSDETVESVALPGATEILVGFASSSKLRRNDSDGLLLSAISIKPTIGIPAQNNLYILNECKSPNAAKLLMRWALGEADGKGPGYKAWNTKGGFSVRNNSPLIEGNPPLDFFNVSPFEPEFIYYAVPDFIDFIYTLR